MIAIASKKFRECIGLNCAEINLQHLGTFAFPVHYCSITGDPSLPSKAAGDTIRKGLRSTRAEAFLFPCCSCSTLGLGAGYERWIWGGGGAQ